MALENQFDFEEMQKILDNLRNEADVVQSSLRTMDDEIKEAVGENGRAWDGVSAQEFRNSWDELAENINGFKETIASQISNVEQVMNTMQRADESGTGAVEDII